MRNKPESAKPITKPAPWPLTVLPAARLAIYCGFGAVLWICAAAIPAFAVVALLYNLVLIFVALIDLCLSPQPDDFHIEREFNAKMNLGVPNEVLLRLRNNSSHKISVLVRDEPPPDWLVSVQTRGEALADVPQVTPDIALLPQGVARIPITITPGRSAWAIYHVTPTRRGDYEFGALSGRYSTLLGLWQRQWRTPTVEHARVYPDNTGVRRYELRLRQGRLRDIGLHLIRLRGRGTEFESLRDYSSDDEYKDINWKASAKQGKLISTNYEIERDQTVMIAVDCGRMMTSMAITRDVAALNRLRRERGEEVPEGTTVPLSKLDSAINATVLLAHVAASMGDSVGLLLFADRVLHYVPPRKGRVQTGAIIEALYAAQPSLVEPDYTAAYEYLLTRKVRRALVVTFTDLIDPAASRELLTASAALRRHHNALCVTISNNDVSEMARQYPEASDQLYQKAMAQRMLALRHQALEELRRRAVGILDVAAEQLTIATVNRYLDLKSRAAF